MTKTNFWKDKTVLVTGHNGFKGSWLTKWLDMLGAKVVGLSLPSEEDGYMDRLGMSERFEEIIGDISDMAIASKLIDYKFDIVFHLAAQAIVKTAKENPVKTFETNVMGTVNLLETLRKQSQLGSILVVTSDKVYMNVETYAGYSEDSPLMGSEPYSCSKVCEEQVAKAYYESYFKELGVGVATARGSNCFGGGDYHFERLIPYLEKCAYTGAVPEIRNPESVRPWQYVLDLINGYMTLARNLYENRNSVFECYNFGPDSGELYTVGQMAEIICRGLSQIERQPFYEASLLFISSDKAGERLNWRPLFSLAEGLSETTEAYRAYFEGKPYSDIYRQCIQNFDNKEGAENEN